MKKQLRGFILLLGLPLLSLGVECVVLGYYALASGQTPPAWVGSVPVLCYHKSLAPAQSERGWNKLGRGVGRGGLKSLGAGDESRFPQWWPGTCVDG